MNITRLLTTITARPHNIHHYLFGVIFLLAMMSVNASPVVDHTEIDFSQTILAEGLLALDSSDELIPLTRDLVLGVYSAQDFSLKSSARASQQTPPEYAKGHSIGLLDPDTFERELFGQLSSVLGDESAATEDPWLDSTALSTSMNVEVAQSSHASIPEPTTLMLVTVGILGLILHRRRTNWAAS